MSDPGPAGAENIMAMSIGSDLADSAVRDPALNTIGTSINIHGKLRNEIQANATGSYKQGISNGNLNVNGILTEADNAAVAALTIALAPGTITGTDNTVNSGVDINTIDSTTDTSSIQNAMVGPPAANYTASNSAVGIYNSNANPNITPNITTNGIPEVSLDTKISNSIVNNPTNMSNANNMTTSMNLNQYILASAGVPTTTLQTNPALPMSSASHNNLNFNVANANTHGNVDGNTSNGSVNTAINNNQHFQSAILQQNAAIMRQNAATLQQLQSLQNTNKLLAANPEAAATLGMLAPIMNMNFTTTNPVQLLATATPLSLSNNCGATNTSASILPPATTSLQATAANFPEVDGVSAITTVPITAQQGQPRQNQQQGMPVPAQPGTIAIAQGGSQMFPGAGISNSINFNVGSIANSNTGVVDGVNNTNNDAVQNFLRTALLLQNSGLPFLQQQGIIPQQQQIIPATAGSGFMLVPNNNANYNNIPFGIVPTFAPANNNDSNDISDSSSRSNESNSKRNYSITSDGSNNGGGGSSGAAAAANAAASVLPPASMNLPLQQQLQQQQLNTSFTPQMGIDLSGSNNNNNAMALLGGAALNNNNINSGSSINNNSLQIAGLSSLQQQQRLQTMAYAPMNPSQSHSQLALPSPQQQKQQQPSLGNTLNLPPDPRTTTTTQLKQQQSQPQKKQTSIPRPLYLDHDSNCLTAYQCFLRKQIELFEVGHDEMTGTAQGRNTPLHYGQVGIRCRHCSHLPKATRARGGVYYSRTIDGVYQVAQNMSKLHFLKACTLIPESTKNQLRSLQSVSSRASGGKEYWAEGLRVLGIVEKEGMLRFASRSSSPSSTQISKPSK